MSNIEFINIDRINSHPNNPRKDLGDLKELTESIKTKGVLQNLTVVQSTDHKDKYTVVIGHRRLAAAKAAGLEQVPCIFSNMSEKEQIETMLIENMQRNDLTTYEQAGGFQMMIDFGDSISALSKNTGFAESTIKHRLKIMELDKEAVEQAEKKQIKISDYIALEKIEDKEIRNRILRSYGTSNYNWEYRDAIDEQNRDKREKVIVEELEKFAKKIPEQNTQGHYQFICSYRKTGRENIEKPKEKGEYYYRINYYDIDLYKKTEINTEENKEEDKQRAKIELKRKEAEQLNKNVAEIIKAFISEYTYKKEHAAIINGFIAGVMVNSYYHHQYISLKDVCKILRIKEEEEYDKNVELISKAAEEQGIKALLLIIYILHKNSIESGYINTWSEQPTQKANNSLNHFYEFLLKIGYQMSDEEKQLQDGTHEIFKNENEEIKE